MMELPIPAFRTYTVHVPVNQPVVECITAVAQLMESYADLTPYGKRTVAEWFAREYSRDSLDELLKARGGEERWTTK